MPLSLNFKRGPQTDEHGYHAQQTNHDKWKNDMWGDIGVCLCDGELGHNQLPAFGVSFSEALFSTGLKWMKGGSRANLVVLKEVFPQRVLPVRPCSYFKVGTLRSRMLQTCHVQCRVLLLCRRHLFLGRLMPNVEENQINFEGFWFNPSRLN